LLTEKNDHQNFEAHCFNEIKVSMDSYVVVTSFIKFPLLLGFAVNTCEKKTAAGRWRAFLKGEERAKRQAKNVAAAAANSLQFQ
jgi:hypothetical protein